jgi:hypothetical protein
MTQTARQRIAIVILAVLALAIVFRMILTFALPSRPTESERLIDLAFTKADLSAPGWDQPLYGGDSEVVTFTLASIRWAAPAMPAEAGDRFVAWICSDTCDFERNGPLIKQILFLGQRSTQRAILRRYLERSNSVEQTRRLLEGLRESSSKYWPILDEYAEDEAALRAALQEQYLTME